MWATLVRAHNPTCAWCHEILMGASDVTVRILAHVPAGDGRVWEEAELVGAKWPERLDAMRKLPAMRGLTLLEQAPDKARVRLDLDECPLLHAVNASGVLPRFPFQLRDGADEWLIISEREQAERFVGDLRTRGVQVEIASSREYRPNATLTDRQRELMQAAIAQGYYEVPRRVTLTELARRLKVAKSTLSETLARGERHLLNELHAPPPSR
jgi:hypothetical protein